MNATSLLAAEIADLICARIVTELDRRLSKLEASFEQRLVGVEALAEMLDISESAARQRVRRDPLLQQIAIAGGDGKHWRWRRGDLLVALQVPK